MSSSRGRRLGCVAAMSALRPLLILSLLADAVGASADPSLQWINSHVFQRIKLTGRRVLGYHMQRFTGDGDAFQTLTYYGQGGKPFTDYGQVSLSGRKVLGVLNFQMQLQNNRFGDPQGQKVSLNYAKGPLSVDLGDIQGSLLNTNQFAFFNKTLSGAMAGIHTGRVQLRAVRSSVKGSVRTVSISGNGSQGPYYLNASQIIPDSEKVMVDGVVMKLGVDYTINYEAGSISFSGKTIPQTSTIVASYESYSYNSAKGTVQGIGASYDFGKIGALGLTSIEQLVGGDRTLTQRTDLFQGFGSPSTPYFLQFTPLLTIPPVVKVDGIVQTPGIDYVFDPGNPSIFFFMRFMPATSNIDVTYTPAPSQAVDGNRKVTGFDYTIKLKNNGRINYSQATGKLEDSLTPLSGTARGLTADYNWKGLRFRGSVRDVPDGYVGIETRGFNRNEKATDLALDAGKGPLKYGISTSNSLVSTKSEDTQGNFTFSRARVTYSRAYLGLDGGGTGAWSLVETRSVTDGASGSTRVDTTGISNTRRIGKLGVSLGLQRLQGYGPIAGQLGLSQGSIRSDTIQLRSDYDVGKGLSMAGRGSFGNTDTNGESGHGIDLSLSANYHPMGRWSLDATYAYSRAGELAALSSFQNGLGFGYGGNGFSQVPTGTPYSNSGTDLRSFQVSSAWRMTKRANLEARFSRSDVQGLVSSNTKSQSVGGGLQLDLGRSTALSIALDRTNTGFFGSSATSRADTLDFYMSGSPLKRWSFFAGASALLSNGSQFGQDRFAFDGGLVRRISARENISLQFQDGHTTGYLPQDDSYIGLLYSHQIVRNIALTGSYKMRRLINLDPTQSTGGFRSHGFDLEMTFDFSN